jgi:glycosyltransferase involved in cell wall biosynthesis
MRIRSTDPTIRERGEAVGETANGDAAAIGRQSPKPQSVAILLCTYNGARFLPQQLASFETQDVTDWRLYVSDDGSTDGTQNLLQEFQIKHGTHKVSLRRGPGRGFVANFLSLICDPALDCDYYALSDQDDIWEAHKLSRACSSLIGISPEIPCLYGSRARMIDEDGAAIGLTPLFRKIPQFRHALVQNIAMGNTMVFNEKARSVLMRIGPDAGPAVHDWWLYLVISAIEGKIIYDPVPTVAYRIHNQNLIGSTRGRVSRAKMLLNRFKVWNDSNVAALARIEASMPEENKRAFELFRHSRELSLLPRIHGLLRSGIHRESVRDNLDLMVATLIGKI